MRQEQAGEGCHLFGKLLVNKVAGNFHIAPGKSFQQVRLLLGFLENCAPVYKYAAGRLCNHVHGLSVACGRSQS